MTRRIAVVHEARADFEDATLLADRVLLESIDWLEEDLLPTQREWVSHHSAGLRLKWTNIDDLARAAGIRARGHFEGEPGRPDAATARRAILFLLNEYPDLQAIVLIRDQDDQPERRTGLDQARQVTRRVPIVVGLAVVEREAWIISGFDPRDEHESARLSQERATLGFDPRLRSHELTACKDDQAKRSPKRVLRELSSSILDREKSCLVETSLETLRERGSENGLRTYVDEVHDQLRPLIDVSARPNV